MKQKRLNDILYVYSLEPYVITSDTDADIIFVQEELFDDYKKLNPTLNQLAKKNYDILTVITPKWNEYRYLPEEKEDPNVPLNLSMTNIPIIDMPYDDTVVADTSVSGFQMFENGDVNADYSSSNENVATIDEGGYVDIVNAGTTVITASYQGDESYNEYNKEYNIVVNDSGENLIDPDISMTNIQLHNGESAPLVVTNPYGLPLVYSTNSSELYVDSDGVVTANVDVIDDSPIAVYATFIGDSVYKSSQIKSDATVLEERENSDLYWLYNDQMVLDVINVALDSENTFPTLSNIHNLEVTYSVSDTDYATIDQNGNITLVASTGADTILVNAIFAGNDNYKPATVSYSLKIKPTSKGYAFSTVRPTVSTLPNLMDLDGAKPTSPEIIDMTDLTKPTDMYLVFPIDWEVVENGFIEKPIVTDDANGGEIGMWWDESNPVLNVGTKQYRIECIQLGKGTFTIIF